MNEISLTANTNKLDIVTLSETWLTPDIDDSCVNITGFQPIVLKDRVGHAGGVVVLVRDGIAFTRRQNLATGYQFGVESIEILLSNSSILVGTYYCPPGQTGQDKDIFLNFLSASLSDAVEYNCQAIFITGDFNDRCLTLDSLHSDSELGLKLYDLINRNDLFQIIKSPTRITDQSSSLLDLIITDAPQLVNCSGTLAPIGSSDHCVVFCRLKPTVLKPNSYKRQVWNYNSADWTGLSNALDNAPFDTAYTNYEDINDIIHYWTSLVTSTCAEFIPS